MDKSRLIYNGLVIVIFLVITGTAVYFFPGIWTYVPGCERFYPIDPAARYSEGQVITGSQAQDLISVSENDPYVKERLDRIVTGAENGSYVTGNITVIRYLERNPEITYGIFVPHYFKVLPAVEYIPGEPQDEGVNMYAFVDPDRARVTYIGYTVRPGMSTGNVTRVMAAESVLLFANGSTAEEPVETMANVTIVDTGYNLSTNLTEEQKTEYIAVALNDSRVQHYIDGFGKDTVDGVEYEVELYGSYWWKAGSSHNYIIYYPTVDFLTLDSDQQWVSFIQADIDPRCDQVVEFHPPDGLKKFR